jgi:hypothetical protein
MAYEEQESDRLPHIRGQALTHVTEPILRAPWLAVGAWVEVELNRERLNGFRLPAATRGNADLVWGGPGGNRTHMTGLEDRCFVH